MYAAKQTCKVHLVQCGQRTIRQRELWGGCRVRRESESESESEQSIAWRKWKPPHVYEVLESAAEKYEIDSAIIYNV